MRLSQKEYEGDKGCKVSLRGDENVLRLTGVVVSYIPVNMPKTIALYT